MTDPLGQSQVLPYLVGLSEKGWRVTLISADKPERANVVPLIEGICNKAGIDWHPISYTKKPPVLSTWLDIRKILKLATQLHKEKQFSIVHCRSYISALVGLKLKKKFNLPFLFDMRGFWADERLDGGIWNVENPLFQTVYNFFKKKEKQFLEEAAYTVSLTYKAKDIIVNDILGADLPIEVIPCCADTKHFSEESVDYQEVERLKKRLDLSSGDKLIAYVGSLGTWYLLNEMLVFFKLLTQKYPRYKFLILTLDDPSLVYEKAKFLKIKEDRIIVRSSTRAELPNYMKLIKCSIFFIKSSFSKQASSPTKMGELMSMGVPVIANEGVGDSTEVIKRYKSGLLVDLKEENSMQKTIDQFDKLVSLNKREIRKGAIDFFSLEEGVNKYDSIYKKILDEK